MEIRGVADVGAYVSKSLATFWRATVETTGPYNVENVSTVIKFVLQTMRIQTQCEILVHSKGISLPNR